MTGETEATRGPAADPPIRAVVSDFGGVLTTPLVQLFLAFEEESGVSMEELGQAMQAATVAADGRHPLHELERGHLSEAEFLARLETQLAEGVRLESFRDTYFAHLHPNERMIEYMRELKARGLRMALLTNNVREWEPKWRAKLPDVDEIFEVVVDSAFVGTRKPEPAIYRITVERLGRLRPAECLLVDDVQDNCEGARAQGMRAVRFLDTDQAIAAVEAELDAARLPRSDEGTRIPRSDEETRIPYSDEETQLPRSDEETWPGEETPTNEKTRTGFAREARSP